MKASTTVFNGVTVASVINLFLQKNADVYLSSIVLSIYKFFSEYGSDSLQLRVFFDAFLKKDFKAFGDPWKVYLRNNIRKMNMSEVYDSLMAQLWYSKLPCFDITGLTAMEDNDSSFIKNCKWKGIPIPCASIFTMVPTDQGLCCAFNVAEANAMYADSLFSKTLQTLQANDKNSSFESSILPDWYVKNNEPWSKPGISMGLSVTLDAHTELLDAFSVSSSFDSFEALIQPSGDFPFMSRGGFKVLSGFHNLINCFIRNHCPGRCIVKSN